MPAFFKVVVIELEVLMSGSEIEINPWERYTNIYKALSDVKRLKIMWLLMSVDSKLSVSEIICVLGESQYNVSKHLRILKNSDLIYEKKDGKWTFYYYRTKDDEFDTLIRKTVMAIPDDLIVNEISRCQECLILREEG